jgi:pilus assembly protein Flp/PilA
MTRGMFGGSHGLLHGADGNIPRALLVKFEFHCHLPWQVDCPIFSILYRNGGIEMKNLLKRFWQEEEGQDLVEYGLLLVLVSLGAVAAMGTLASAISNAFGNAQKNLSSS